MSDGLELLVCRLGPHRVAIPARQVVEVLPMLELSVVPSAPRHCLGVFDFRGTLAPAYDLGARLGVTLDEPLPARHLLVAQMGADLEAWMVDRIVDLRTGALQPAPELSTAPESTALLLGFLEVDDARLPVIDTTQLLRPGVRAAAQALFGGRR